MAKQITVTGGAGFLGRALIARCAGWTVTSLDRSPLPQDTSQAAVHHIVAEVTDGKALEESIASAELVFIRHGIVGGNASIDLARCRDYLRVNAEAVQLILTACDKAGCRRVILDSSEQVFGGSGDLWPQLPDSEPSPFNFYGASKLIAEKSVRMWAHDAPRRSAQIFRYSRVRAAASRDVIFHMAASCLAGRPMKIVGNSGHRISFVHVDDVVAANLRALELEPKTAIYHVSSDRPVTLFELAERVRALANKDVPIVFEETSAAAFEPYVVGMAWEESASELGVVPRYGLDDMIRQTLAWLEMQQTH